MSVTKLVLSNALLKYKVRGFLRLGLFGISFLNLEFSIIHKSPVILCWRCGSKKSRMFTFISFSFQAKDEFLIHENVIYVSLKFDNLLLTVLPTWYITQEYFLYFEYHKGEYQLHQDDLKLMKFWWVLQLCCRKLYVNFI